MTYPPWLIELPTCPSTNDWALAHRDALAHGACVWTRSQTRGRGRDGARWHAPPGVLTASFALEVAGALDATRLSLAAGLAVCHAVEDCCAGVRVELKWPNDCLLGERKLAGILCERPANGLRDAVVVGIGLNVDPQWGEDHATLPFAAGARRPIGLAEASGAAPPAMPLLLVALRRYLLEACGMIAASSWRVLIPLLGERDWLRSRDIRVESGGEELRGIADGIDDEGRLRLRTAAGVRALASAHVVAVSDRPTTGSAR